MYKLRCMARNVSKKSAGRRDKIEGPGKSWIGYHCAPMGEALRGQGSDLAGTGALLSIGVPIESGSYGISLKENQLHKAVIEVSNDGEVVGDVTLTLRRTMEVVDYPEGMIVRLSLDSLDEDGAQVRVMVRDINETGDMPAGCRLKEQAIDLNLIEERPVSVGGLFFVYNGPVSKDGPASVSILDNSGYELESFIHEPGQKQTVHIRAEGMVAVLVSDPDSHPACLEMDSVSVFKRTGPA